MPADFGAMYADVDPTNPRAGARLPWAREPNGDIERDLQPQGYAASAGPSSSRSVPAAEGALPAIISSPRRNNSVYPIFGRDFDPRDRGRSGEVVGWQWRHVGGTANRFGDRTCFFNGTVPTGLKWNPRPSVDKHGLPLRGFSAGTWSVAGAKRAVAHVFHPDFWGNWVWQVAGVNASATTLKFGRGGWQEAHGGGIREGQPFFVEGVREALDAEGEWWVDADTRTLYILPNGTAAATASAPEPATTVGGAETGNGTSSGTSGSASARAGNASNIQLVAPLLATLIGVRGEDDASGGGGPVINVTLSGLRFAHTAATFLQPYVVPSPGDWSIHPGGALFVDGSDDLDVDQCRFDRVGGNAIFLSGHAWRTRVTRSEFALVGDSAIATVGTLGAGNNGITRSDYPLDTKIVGNHFHEIGVTGKQSAAWFSAVSCRTTFSGNVAYNGPRAGVNINDGFCHGHIIERNLLFNWVRETQDHGFVTWRDTPLSPLPSSCRCSRRARLLLSDFVASVLS
jgi:hypothetical protein